MADDRSKDKTPPTGPHGDRGIKRRDLLLSGSSLMAASALTTTGVIRSANAELKEYKPGTTFPGRMGRTIGESSPAWPAPVRAKPGAPNVLFIVLDDTGFSQLGCYGSPINTPNIDKLAKGGLLYTNMHTTALCSPSRSCMLTGRNHHSNAMACITEGSEGYPGSNGAIPFENGFLSEILLGQGYNTYALGKWHLTPAEQISAAGPYDRWPLGRGFERYYGFLGGDTSQYYPDLVYDNRQVEPPKTPEQGYHLTPDLVDKAISFIGDSKQLAPDKPFFVYFATGAMHAPHHAPKEWADRYKGKFDDGWDAYREKVFARQKELGIIPKNTVLSRHDPDVQDWSKLSADERRLYSRMMEVFAGYLEHTDHHIGRLIDYLAATGELHNTLIMLISDNGASSEGGPTGSTNENKFFNNVPDDLKENLAALDDLGGPKYFNHYAWGWTFAGNTPFKRETRDLSGRHFRSLPRALAEGHQCQGRNPRTIRACNRHGANCARCAWYRAADGYSRRDPVANRRRELCAYLRRRQGAQQAPHSVLRDVRTPRRLPRRLAGSVSITWHFLHRSQGILRAA